MTIESKVCNFGWEAVDFKLKSIDAKYYSLNDLKGTKGTLIMFICNHCPYVKAISNKISYETIELNKIGINSIAIMSNDVKEHPEDSFTNMQLFSKKNNFLFPYLYDESQDIAKKYNAQCTPDFFGFNKHLHLQYRGRLDSSGKNIDSNNTERELYNAMNEISLTDKGPKKQIPSIGCSIKWKKK